MNKRAAVVDADLDTAAVVLVGDADDGVEREMAAGGGELMPVEVLAAGREAALLLEAVPRGEAGLGNA